MPTGMRIPTLIAVADTSPKAFQKKCKKKAGTGLVNESGTGC